MALKSIALPYCWVCGRRFVTSVPPGPALEEVHHLVPQAQGGTAGPTVTLCDTHHAMLHKIAYRLHKKKPHFDLVSQEPLDAQKKLLWMASVVYNAEQQMADDPNKRTAVVLSVDARQRQMLDRLKKLYPSCSSRAAILNLALEQLYARHFNQNS